MNKKLHDENNTACFHFSGVEWLEGDLRQIFNDAVKSTLCDVDFIAETNDNIVFVEYKNAAFHGVSKPDAFKPNHEESIIKIARKFYGSLIYLLAKGKVKPVRYVYVLEYPHGDSVTRKAVRDKIVKRLPFELQNKTKAARKLICDFDVLSIDEWNKHAYYGKWKIQCLKNKTS